MICQRCKWQHHLHTWLSCNELELHWVRHRLSGTAGDLELIPVGGTPLRTYCRSLATPSYITVCFQLKRYFWKSSYSTPLTPVDDRFSKICAWLSVSNTLLWLINTEPVSFLSFLLFSIWSVKSVTADSVFQVDLQLSWWFDSKLFDYSYGSFFWLKIVKNKYKWVCFAMLWDSFNCLSFFSLTNTSEAVTGISLKASLVFILALCGVDQMKFLNLIDFSFKAPAIFEKNKQNPLAMDFLVVVHLALMLNDWAGDSLVLVGKIALIIFQNLLGFFFIICQDRLVMRFLCLLYNVFLV